MNKLVIRYLLTRLVAKQAALSESRLFSLKI